MKPTVRESLRKMFVTELWYWSIRLRFWATKRDKQHVAHLDREVGL
jgi:hypothetical protein